MSFRPGKKQTWRRFNEAGCLRGNPDFPGAVTVSGRHGDDAKPYQEKQVRRAVEEVNK